MTYDEFDRLKESLLAKQWNGNSNEVDLEKAAAAAKAPKEPRRQLDDGKRWNQFKESAERRHAEIREFGARSDAKIRALVEEMRRRNSPQS